MHLFTTAHPLGWGSLDLPLLGITKDWHGHALVTPVAFALASDGVSLWFVATRQAPATVHPDAKPGAFTPGLWKHDVAELFIADAGGSAYMEFNIAANGAWWACKFDSARKPADSQPDFAGAIHSHHDPVDPDSWLTALEIPIGFLRHHIDFGLGTRANVAFILNSPEQTFHSASKLSGPDPDFHQPHLFEHLIPTKNPNA